MNDHYRVAGRRAVAVTVLSLVTVAGCHKKPQAAPTPVPAPAPAIDSTAIRDSIARARQRDADLAAQRAREDSIRRANEAAASEQTTLRNTLTSVIYFDFDKSDLRDDARSTLDAKVPVLTANSDVNLRIAGNTDERGSTEYNLALGQRRAATAKRYLEQHGVSGNRIETISYGEERPVAQGHDESAWSQNRRDEFEITSGGTRLNRPTTP